MERVKCAAEDGSVVYVIVLVISVNALTHQQLHMLFTPSGSNPEKKYLDINNCIKRHFLTFSEGFAQTCV